jgi:hypothetical protein
MKQLVTLHDPIKDIQSIKIYEPKRGIGGTAAFQVMIDDIEAIFEMDDECNWESNFQGGKIDREVISFISNQLELLTA